MVKLITLFLVAGYAIGGAAVQRGPRAAHAGGCACPCDAGPVRLVIWNPEDGEINRFVARTIKRGYRSGEPLILLGTSPKGVWSIETRDDENDMRINLVRTTDLGKREAYSVIRSYPTASYQDPGATPAGLSSRVLQGLQRLKRLRKWLPEGLLPIPQPLLSSYPRLVLRETGDFLGESYSWTLRAKTNAILPKPVASGEPGLANGGGYYRDSKCVAGVADGSGGEIWWIHIAFGLADDCWKEWRVVRLQPAHPKVQ
jgi:hypothetical protein